MAIINKKNQTEILARKLSELTGETIAEAVGAAVAERYERLCRSRTGRSLIDDLTVIALRCANRLIVSQLSDDEILSYDHYGNSTR